MFRITSASGTTTAADEDIMSAMRAVTSESAEGFRVKALYLECGAETTVKINGENETFLDLIGTKYVLDLGRYDVIVKTLVITDASIAWKARFLY